MNSDGDRRSIERFLATLTTRGGTAALHAAEDYGTGDVAPVRVVTTGDTLPAPPDQYGAVLLAGARLGSFVVDEFVAEGGFAALYRGHDAASGQTVALKVLGQGIFRVPVHARRFVQEAEILTRLRHRNIVDILAFGELPDGRPFLAMEWLDGGTLRDRLCDQGRFSAESAAAILADVGAGLAAGHALGIVHRDVKAVNIVTVVGPEPPGFRCKLIDFGIAKLVAPGDVHGSVTTHGIVGTVSTMAPEQILAETIDARTDIYALGVLLYQLVVGRLPFDGSPAEIEAMHLSAPRPLPSRDSNVPAALDAVVQKAMAVSRHDRHATVAGFLEHVQAVLGNARAPACVAGRAPVAGIGLRVHARPRPGVTSGYDGAVDEVIELAAAAMTASELHITDELATAIVAVRRLPDGDDGVRVRRALAAVAIELQERLGRAIRDVLDVCIAVRVAPVEIDGDAWADAHAMPRQAPHFTGGALLRLGAWPATRSGVHVVANAAALAGLDLARTPLGDEPVPGASPAADEAAFELGAS